MTSLKSSYQPLAHGLSPKNKGSCGTSWVFLSHICTWSLVLDQGSKWWARHSIAPGKLHHVTPFLDWAHVWNRGISFGLFPCQTPWSRLILGLMSGVFIGFLLILCAKSLTPIQRWGSGLMVGGALSNGLDRILYHGVFDFIRLHWGTWDFPVFNLADMLITMGFLALLSEHFQWNALRFQKKRY